MQLFIQPSHIQIITGMSYSTACRILLSILESKNKVVRNASNKIIKKELLTIRDFCEYYGLEEEEVKAIVNKSPIKP